MYDASNPVTECTGPFSFYMGNFLGLNGDFAVIFSGGLAGDLEGSWVMIYSC